MKKYFFTILLSFLLVISLPSFAVTHIITVQNYSFTPSSLTGVTVGDTIHWQWINGAHTTTSTTIPSGAAPWDQDLRSTSPTFDYKVTVPGVFNYKCTPHAVSMGMVASFTASSAVTLNVTPGNQNVASSAGNTSFSVTTGSPWTASSNATWCSVTPSGNGNGTISAAYEENTSSSQRVATILVVAGGVIQQLVTVTQAGAAPTLGVTPPNQNVPASAGSTSFSVSSNANWTASSDVTWCTATPSGTGNGSITAGYQENTSSGSRVATITISVTGLTPQHVTVTQDGSGVGIGEHGQGTFRMFPNPTAGQVTIIPGGDPEIPGDISILDIAGKTVISESSQLKKELHYDLSAFPGGIYFVRIRSAQNLKLERLIVR